MYMKFHPLDLHRDHPLALQASKEEMRCPGTTASLGKHRSNSYGRLQSSIP